MRTRPEIVALLLALTWVGCGDDSIADAGDADAGMDSGVDGCAAVAETCNGADDDCDGVADEGYDLMSDLAHCGACDRACPIEGGTTGFNECAGGSCALAVCASGSMNCDEDPTNGCESDLVDLANCGACGAPCTIAGAEASCASGACERVACLDGFADCDGRPENGCEVALYEDVLNCGACDRQCSSDRPNSRGVCDEGACGIGCDPSFGDCNGDPSDGCEVSLTVPTTCGGCGTVCGAGQLCSGSVAAGYRCVDPPCVDPPTRCVDSCVDLTTNPSHCGACGTVCPSVTNASSTCSGSACGFDCDLGFGDCDGDASNGCEMPLNTATDCTACGVACPPGVGVCSGLLCITTCPAGLADCDGDPVRDCETTLATDPMHCGACDNPCASGTCAASACEPCPAPSADCDGLPATGCEIDLDTDGRNCGLCENRCATGSCTGGVCDSSCTTGCDGCSAGCCTESFGGGSLSCEDSSCFCNFDCASVSGTCSPDCDESTCGIDCTNSNECDARCRGGGDCTVDCRGNYGACQVDCDEGSRCLLDCNGATGVCRIDDCGGGTGLLSCGAGITVCNRPCP